MWVSGLAGSRSRGPGVPASVSGCSWKVSLGRKIKTLATKMVITSGNDEDRGGQEKESKEESVLAMLGIVGTILNLIVIIFVYIYTTL
ncbi:protein TUNAR isoform X1 [Myotis yumanensis]|uniref:protein TUNAR isoform X1 n=1 Tax=Myotis yumanensis TaxID=159337 RepID=UPI0038D13FD2